MRQVVLGRTGLKVSAVGFGGIPIQRLNDADAVDVIRRTLDLGVTFIDTAAGYGDSQRKIGQAIRGRREGLVLASKSGNRQADGILADIECACEEMGTDTIDLYQLHGVSKREAWDEIQAAGGALEGLRDARDRGLIHHIGVTSHSLDLALELVECPDFETIQFPFNLVTSEPANELIPKARERGLGFIVMKPLCGGQYHDAELAFRFLNGYADVVPIPGIETAAEIEQIVEIVASGRVLEGETATRAARIAAELGKQFCRRCGYCQPCPEGVAIQQVMIFESMVKRMPEARISGIAARVRDTVARCTECGDCESKCPYELPIREIMQRMAGMAEALA